MAHIVESYSFLKGEVGPVTVVVVPEDGTSPAISNVTYQVCEADGTTVGSQETATVVGYELTAAVAAGSTAGDFYVEFAFDLGAYDRRIRVLFTVS